MGSFLELLICILLLFLNGLAYLVFDRLERIHEQQEKHMELMGNLAQSVNNYLRRLVNKGGA